MIELAFKYQPSSDAGPEHKRQAVLDAFQVAEPQFGQSSRFAVIDDRDGNLKFRLEYFDEGNAIEERQRSAEGNQARIRIDFPRATEGDSANLILHQFNFIFQCRDEFTVFVRCPHLLLGLDLPGMVDQGQFDVRAADVDA